MEAVWPGCTPSLGFWLERAPLCLFLTLGALSVMSTRKVPGKFGFGWCPPNSSLVPTACLQSGLGGFRRQSFSVSWFLGRVLADFATSDRRQCFLELTGVPREQGRACRRAALRFRTNLIPGNGFLQLALRVLLPYKCSSRVLRGEQTGTSTFSF